MTLAVSKKNILLGSISIIHTNWLPYAAGCLISYCKKIPEIDEQFKFLNPIYKHKPLKYYKKLLETVDIFGLTCYVWNQAYNDKLAAYFKEINPDGIVLFGGPQIPDDPILKAQFDLDRPFLTESIAGMGEIAFSEYLLNIPYTNARLKDVPTPYTDGVFDEMLNSKDKFKVSFETNRGCPYSCAFCDWGGQAKSKLDIFDINNIHDTIRYIYKHDNILEVEILDANFGILNRDESIIDYMISTQEELNNYLKISYSGLAKNGSKSLTAIMKKIVNNLPVDQRNLKISFQTHTQEVLNNILRHNIKNEKLLPMIEEFKKEGIPSTAEMIIALPGETADSWLKSLDTNYTLGIDYIRTYFLHLVSNIEMTKQSYKDKFNIKTKIIDIHGQEFEIMHRYLDMELEDYVKMFDYHWFYHNLVNSDILKPHINNIYYDCLVFFAKLKEMPEIEKIINDHRDLVRRIFADEPKTLLKNPLEGMFFSATMRLDDVERIMKNPKVHEELENHFNIKFDLNWECEFPRRVLAVVT